MTTLAPERRYANEKHVLHRVAEPHFASPGCRRESRKPFTTIFAVVAFVALLTIFHVWDDRLAASDRERIRASTLHLFEERTAAEADFNWDTARPSKQLEYHSCYNETFYCARLDVPMSYNRTDGKGSRMQIAVIRLPAPVPVTDPRYGGPVFINPGGPGGSGVGTVLSSGRDIQTIVNPEGDLGAPHDDPPRDEGKYFDIISFDPRGIGYTTPSISCFPDSYSRTNWALEGEAIGMLGSSESALTRHWYRSKAQGEGCSAGVVHAYEGEDALEEHVNTTPTVRDMLEILDAHTRWVGEQHEGPHPPEELRDVKEPAKLQYWGFSYGTIIGQTFAAMYPDRVGRVVVDGVVDPNDYHHGPWFTNLPDTDKILQKLFSYCFSAGPSACPIYDAAGPSAINTKYTTLMQSLSAQPLPVPASLQRGPEVITWSNVISLVRLSMYQPLLESPLVYSIVSGLMNANGSQFADYKQSLQTQTCPTEECRASGPYSSACNRQNGRDASSAIMCTDGPGLGEVDLEGFEVYMRKLAEQSKVLGLWWSHERLGCVGWKARAKWRFDGPFQGNTSHPLLFLSTSLDPVTPLNNAARMSTQYTNAILLEQESEGHTTLSAPSICTASAVRKYFQTGSLPERGTKCQPVERPFLGVVGSGKRSVGEDRVVRAIEGIGRVVVGGMARGL